MEIALFGGVSDVRQYPLRDGEQFIATFGSMEIDLTQAALPEYVRISTLAVFGSIKLIVPVGTEVRFRGFALFGNREYKAGHSTNERTAIIEVNAAAVFGNIEVVER